MSEVYIPRYRLVDEPPEKPHYVYVVEVLDAGKHQRVERRYSAFHSLHRELRKQYNTPVFPPKRVRSCHTKVLERRKQTLELYLQAMLRFGPSRNQVLAFLGITKPCSGESSLEVVTQGKILDHQPIYKYKKDPYIDVDMKSNLTDVVAQGVLIAFYGKSYGR